MFCYQRESHGWSWKKKSSRPDDIHRIPSKLQGLSVNLIPACSLAKLHTFRITAVLNNRFLWSLKAKGETSDATKSWTGAHWLVPRWTLHSCPLAPLQCIVPFLHSVFHGCCWWFTLFCETKLLSQNLPQHWIYMCVMFQRDQNHWYVHCACLRHARFQVVRRYMHNICISSSGSWSDTEGGRRVWQNLVKLV